MYTTLNKILKHNPCNQKGDKSEGGWQLLLHNLGKTKADNRKLSFKTILKSNGIIDAVWALKVLAYEDRCLFMADVAESVLHIFEKKYPDDKRPRKAIDAVRDYKSKSITKDQLGEARLAAMAADAVAYADAADAHAVVYADAADAAAAAAGKNKWVEVESIFIKYFC